VGEPGPPGGRPKWQGAPESAVDASRPGGRSRQCWSLPRDAVAITAETVWEQLTSRPARERTAIVRGYLEQLAPIEVARLLELSEAAAKRDVLLRLARAAERRA
jgi:DNA-directed RNA polymerase specialized sigma24 family protein